MDPKKNICIINDIILTKTMLIDYALTSSSDSNCRKGQNAIPTITFL
jgi:hypothetical protein